MSGEKFLELAIKSAFGLACASLGYGLLEAKWLRVERVTIPVPNLPPEFVGTTIAFLSDIHHGPFVPLDYIRRAVAVANSLQPDVVALGGDYVYREPKYAGPSIGELGKLRAKLGRFAVLGNHEYYRFGRGTASRALLENGFVELTNCGTWIHRGPARLRICGVGDFWGDRQNLPAALGDATGCDPVILLSHNPDYAEEILDSRVGLVLSGHTHGGQINFPGFGAPIVPSLYGRKYTRGLVQGPVSKVFVTTGVGTITPAIRFCCRPEIALITLA